MNEPQMKIGILGCGLIGQKRGKQLNPASLVSLYDPNLEKAEALSKVLNVPFAKSEDIFFKENKFDIAY